MTVRLVKYTPELDSFHPEINIMIGWLNDPDNVRYSEQRHKTHNYETQIAYLLNGPDVFRKIYVGDEFIGTISAYTDRNNSVADVGILIGKDYWGKGYGYDAWSTFCDHLLNNGIRKVEAGCMSCNFGMLGVCRKYGMTQEGLREDHFLIGEELTGMTLWAKFNEAV